MIPVLGHMPNQEIFTLRQCIYSPIAHLRDINNFPGSDHSDYDTDLSKDKIITNLHRLFKYCVNPIQNAFPKIGLSSVYRNKELNKLIQGVAYSQHIYGYAADIVSTDVNINTSEIFNWCTLNLPLYHQLIWEYPERGGFREGGGFSWIHISFIQGNNFKEHSVSSLDPKIHKHYESETSYKIGNFTHGIKKADQEIIKIE